MTSLEQTAQQDIERLNQAARLGRELAELVDEWGVTRNDPRAEEIASEMIHKARELLRSSTGLTLAARTS